MSLRRTTQRSLGLQGLCFCRLIVTNSDRRAEAPKQGQDHKSHPSRCMMGRQSSPDDLQVSIDFPSSSASPPPSCSCPCHYPKAWALGESMDQQSEKEHAEEVNSERGPFREGEWVCWEPSPGTSSLPRHYQDWNVLLGHRKEWLMSQMASCIHLAPLLSRFWDVWVALWGHEQDSSMDSRVGPSPMS